MKININAEINGHEIINNFIKELKDKNINPSPESIKIFVLNKQNQEVEIGPEKLVVKFEDKQV